MFFFQEPAGLHFLREDLDLDSSTNLHLSSSTSILYIVMCGYVWYLFIHSRLNYLRI